jgi:hypothetical protein
MACAATWNNNALAATAGTISRLKSMRKDSLGSCTERLAAFRADDRGCAEPYQDIPQKTLLFR